MYGLIVELAAKPAFDGNLEALLRELAAAAALEEGTLFYAVHRPVGQDNAFVLYELYRDRTAWDVHVSSEILQQALQRFDDWLVVPPKITYCEAVTTTPVG
ncbi:MAG: antibiotic biosynthesis monooxygenase [Proteobacteria bacterium]|nr:antibiotic biosynthesis monooxygenase [Pseudomonadota bacterium]